MPDVLDNGVEESGSAWDRFFGRSPTFELPASAAPSAPKWDAYFGRPPSFTPPSVPGLLSDDDEPEPRASSSRDVVSSLIRQGSAPPQPQRYSERDFIAGPPPGAPRTTPPAAENVAIPGRPQPAPPPNAPSVPVDADPEVMAERVRRAQNPSLTELSNDQLDRLIETDGARYVTRRDESGRPTAYAKDLPEPIGRAMKMRAARSYADSHGETGMHLFLSSSIPFVSSLGSAKEDEEFQEAKERVDRGSEKAGDYDVVARYEALQKEKAGEGVGKQIVRGLAKAPAIAYEAKLAGELVGGAGRALGLIGEAAPAAARAAPPLLSKAGLASAAGSAVRAAPGYVTRQTLATPLAPSLWLQDATRRNLEAGRPAFDPRSFPAAWSLGALSNTVLGTLAPIADKVGGKGLVGALKGRLAAGAAGTLEQQAAYALAGAAKLDTGYGPIPELFSDKRNAAGQRLMVDATVMTGIALLHGGKKPEGGQPHPVMEATAEALRGQARRGASREQAAATLAPAFEAVNGAVREGGGPAEAKAAAERLPDGPARNLARKLAEHVPEPPPPPAKAPEARPDAQTASPRPHLPQTGPEAAPEGDRPAAGQPKAVGGPGTGSSPMSPEQAAAALASEEARLGRLTPNARDAGLGRAAPEAPESSPSLADWPAEDLRGLARHAGLSDQGPEAALRQRLLDHFGEDILRQIDAASQGGPEQRHPALQAFVDTFEGARSTPRAGEMEADLAGRKVSVVHDPANNSVRIDFTWAGESPEGVAKEGRKAGVAAEVQPGSKEFMGKLRDFVDKLREAGTGVEYFAKDGKAAKYKRMLEKQGFEQVGGPEQVKEGGATYRWKPKDQSGVGKAEFPVNEAVEGSGVPGYGLKEIPPKESSRQNGGITPESLIERMRQRKADAAPRPSEPTLKPYAGEPLTDFERQAEERVRSTKYEDVPPELRERVESTVKALEGVHPGEAVRESARAAFASGGEEGLKALLELQEGRLKKQSPAELVSEHDKLRKEFNDAVEELVRDALRSGRREAPVRREIEGLVRQSAQDARLAVENPAAGRTAEGGREGTPAPAAGPEAAGNELIPHEAAPEEVEDVRREAGRAGYTSASAERLIAEANREAQAAARAEVEGPKATEGAGGPATAGDEQRGAAAGQPGEPAGERAGPTEVPAQPAGATGQPGGSPRAAVAPPRPEPVDPVQQAAQDFLQNQSGALNLPVTKNIVEQVVDRIRSGLRGVVATAQELGGHMFPRATRLDPLTGEAMARYVSAPTYARYATPVMIDKLLGPDAPQEARRTAGGLLTEMRLRHMKDVFTRAGEKDAADAVKTIVGADNSPFATEADFQAAQASPEMQQFLQRWQQEMVPLMEGHFRKAQGLADYEPIASETQIPGLPVNLKRVAPEDAATPGTVYVGGGTGNLRNPRLRPFSFARRATGAAHGYDVDLGAIVENSLTEGARAATKADLYRTLEDAGLARWAKPGERVDFQGRRGLDVPTGRPPAGTQANKPGADRLYVHPDVAPEVRKALNVDAPASLGLASGLLGKLTTTNLVSTAEMMWHARNNLTFLTKPGVSLVDFFNNAVGVFKKNPALADELVELARIGAAKDVHPAQPGTLAGSPYNPMQWTGRFLGFIDKVMRLTANDAFDRLKDRGLVQDTETNRRNFISQLGQYNRRAQADIVRLARDTGLGPFATAGTNYFMQGIRSVLMDPGVKATSPEAALRLRTEMLARSVGVLAGSAAMINYALWGRFDGDDKTPLGAVKLGDGADGKTQYWDATDLFSPLKRGARETGLLAVTEGYRAGAPVNRSIDKGVKDAEHAAMHPLLGPGAQFAWTAGTGEDFYGRKLAAKPPPGGTQVWQNLKAALANANPLVSTVIGAEQPGKAPKNSRFWKLLGPFGVRESSRPPGAPPARHR